MVNTYNSILKTILIVFIGLISFNEANASHAMGADLTYTCLGANQYLLRYSFYRDCTGIPAPSTVDVQYSSSCFPALLTVNLLPLPSSPTQISPICPSETSTCDGGSFTGIEEWIYEATVTLPGPCADWTLYHSESARNAAITTLNSSGNLFVYSVINNTNGLCNNSPVFTNRPVPFACQGQSFRFNHGAYDLEGDSLTYELITPRDGPTPADTVEYSAGYSRFQPLTSSPPMTFSLSTGDLFMTPSIAPEVTVVAVLVSEWRNGVLIGQVERDIQITVINCNNMIPALTGINGIPGPSAYQASVCADDELCFWIRSADGNALNTTTITWDNAIPAATFTTYGGHRDSATFCWTPTTADISNTPYCFTATVQDDNCPYMGLQVYSYCIKVNGVEADAGPDQTIPCGATANLLGTATGGNGTYTYEWNPGNVASQTLNGVPVGSYYLSVESAGCSNSDTVQVLPGLGVPAASFSFVSNCGGLPVQFTDLSNVAGSTISSWNWDFDDGNTSTTQNPSHQFTTNGVFNVVLTVSTPTGCVATYSLPVTVNPMPSVNAGNDLRICNGESIAINSVTSAGTILWLPGNLNTQSITVNPSATTTYYLTVTDANGCLGADTMTVVVDPLPVAAFVNTSPVCEGATITFNDGSNVASGNIVGWAWDFGDATTSVLQNPTHQYNTSTTFNVKLLVTTDGGCQDSIVATATVNPIPAVDAGAGQSICPGFNATLNGVGVGSYLWSPGGFTTASITGSPAVTTDYTLTLTDANGCVNSDIATITVNPLPVADAGPAPSVCDGESVVLYGNGGTNYTWLPVNVNTQNYSFTPIASTTLTLIVENSFGCLDTDYVDVQVNPIPVPAIASSGAICQGSVVNFTDQTVIATGSIVDWAWDFGNGLTSNLQNPSSVFNSAGLFNVSLAVSSDNGCQASTNYNLNIWASPVASYTHTNECDGVPITFNSTSTISDASALSYNWNLGDNTTSVTGSLTHQYPAYGAYSAVLHVTSANGCVDSIMQAVNVYALPVAGINLSYACVNQSASIFDASTVPQGVISSWYWTLGDQTSSVETHPIHSYSLPGNYPITVTVVTDHGCVGSTNDVLRIVPPPTVDFVTEDACLGFSIDFTDNSIPATGPIVQYQWHFGDGNVSTDQNPTHIYSAPGFYQVSLSAISDSGCISTIDRPNALEVYAPPVPNFTSNASQADDIIPLVDFLNISTPATFFYWHFGDGDTSTLTSPSHMYDVVGKYDVQLIAIDQRGCVDSITIPIEIKPTSNVYIPNSFTPNNDTRNDLFQIYTYNVAEVQVQIYDRWGIKIVEWNDLFGGWDGRVSGDPAQADTYVYRVATKDVNNKEEVFVGHVSLVR